MHVQYSTLAGNLRSIAAVYNWASSHPNIGDLDDFLCAGGTLKAPALNSLAQHLLNSNPTARNNRLSIAKNFLAWALDPANRGGQGARTPTALWDERRQVESVLDIHRTHTPRSKRIQPLTPEEIHAIRTALGLRFRPDGTWEVPLAGRTPTRPAGVFQRGTWLRNVTMFEVSLDVGIRRGEALKLQVGSLPRGREHDLRVQRFPDDPKDARRKPPAVKTSERLVPLSRGAHRLLNLYLDSPPPAGRPRLGRTPYLFTTKDGDPLSLSEADRVMEKIGERAGVKLSWHRLRHTWAERMAEELKDDPQGWRKLKILGGWEDDKTPLRYVENAIGRQARERLAQYQGDLYAPEGT